MDEVTPRRKARAFEEREESTEVDRGPPTPPPTPPPLPPPGIDRLIEPGHMLGEYLVEKRLGSGGMGEVYLGVNALIGKRAAIKVLKSDLCEDQFSVDRFIAEARVVNQIGHPNIVDVFAFGTTEDRRSYLVMELLEGETLRERIARGPLTLPEICEFTRPLVRALIAAHGKGVVHRDLKPDNVFLQRTENGRSVKLLDFGIAKLVRAETQMQQTASGALVGTPMYLAPEQARAQAVDHRADIYTLGGMMFEMLTGRPPFVASTAFEVVAMHLMEPAEHPSTFAKGLPPELDELVVNMLAKEPSARPTLEDVLRVLDRVEDPARTAPLMIERDSAQSIMVTSKRDAVMAGATVISLPSFPVPERRVPLVAIAVLVLLAAGVGVYLMTRDRGAAPAPVDAPMRVIVTPLPEPAAAVVVPVDAAIVVDAELPADAALLRKPPAKRVPIAPAPPAVEQVAPPPPPPHVDDEDGQLLKRGSVKTN